MSAFSLRIPTLCFVAVTCFFAGSNLPGWWGTIDSATITGQGKAIDGDSVLVGSTSATVNVRLYGIDAPEHDQECKNTGGESWKCGVSAREALAKLVDGRPLRCEVIEQERTGAHRPIALCFDNRVNASEEMVRQGLAWAFERYLAQKPTYYERFMALQAAAKAKRIGVWEGDAQPAWEYRAQRWERYKARAPNGCPMIGNNRRDGEKIYHTPWSPNYASMFEALIANPDTKKEWLCDEDDAVRKGYRRAYVRLGH